jgi:hypothetical protein
MKQDVPLLRAHHDQQTTTYIPDDSAKNNCSSFVLACSPAPPGYFCSRGI